MFDDSQEEKDEFLMVELANLILQPHDKNIFPSEKIDEDAAVHRRAKNELQKMFENEKGRNIYTNLLRTTLFKNKSSDIYNIFRDAALGQEGQKREGSDKVCQHVDWSKILRSGVEYIHFISTDSVSTAGTPSTPSVMSADSQIESFFRLENDVDNMVPGTFETIFIQYPKYLSLATEIVDSYLNRTFEYFVDKNILFKDRQQISFILDSPTFLYYFLRHSKFSELGTYATFLYLETRLLLRGQRQNNLPEKSSLTSLRKRKIENYKTDKVIFKDFLKDSLKPATILTSLKRVHF